MGSLRRWRQIGQGQFHKWETVGAELDGRWEGQHDGQYGPLGTLETSEGRVTFPLPAALRARLTQVRPGTDVRIRYTGLQTTRAGRTFKAFEVFVADPEGVIAPNGDAPNLL
jgi:hypothetical protein